MRRDRMSLRPLPRGADRWLVTSPLPLCSMTSSCWARPCLPLFLTTGAETLFGGVSCWFPMYLLKESVYSYAAAVTSSHPLIAIFRIQIEVIAAS